MSYSPQNIHSLPLSPENISQSTARRGGISSSRSRGIFDDAPHDEVLSRDTMHLLTGLPNTMESILIQAEQPPSSFPEGSMPRSSTLQSVVMRNASEETSSIGFSAFNASNNFRHGNPMSLLNERYNRQPMNLQIRKHYYVAWSKGEDHMPMFTAIFVCPVTGECFTSGELFSDDCVEHERNETEIIYWYKTKQLAKRAAAARAEDCHTYTDAESAFPQFARNRPYFIGGSLNPLNSSDRHLEIPQHVPTTQKNQISHLRMSILHM